MNRFCYVFELIPGVEEKYQTEHQNLWPGVAKAMHRVGVTEYSLFRRGTTVIAVGSCQRSVSETFADLDSDPMNAKWSAHIRALMIAPTDGQGELHFVPEIWRLPAEEATLVQNSTTSKRKQKI